MLRIPADFDVPLSPRLASCLGLLFLLAILSPSRCAPLLPRSVELLCSIQAWPDPRRPPLYFVPTSTAKHQLTPPPPPRSPRLKGTKLCWVRSSRFDVEGVAHPWLFFSTVIAGLGLDITSPADRSRALFSSSPAISPSRRQPPKPSLARRYADAGSQFAGAPARVATE